MTFPDKALAELEAYLSTLKGLFITGGRDGEPVDVKAILERMTAAEAVIYSGLDSDDVKKAKLNKWYETRGILK